MIPSILINTNDFLYAKCVELEFLSGRQPPPQEIWRSDVIKFQDRPEIIMWLCTRSDLFSDHLSASMYLPELIDLIRTYSVYQLCSIHYKY